MDQSIMGGYKNELWMFMHSQHVKWALKPFSLIRLLYLLVCGLIIPHAFAEHDAEMHPAHKHAHKKKRLISSHYPSLCHTCWLLISLQLAHQQADWTEEQQQVNRCSHPITSSPPSDWRLMRPSGHDYNFTNVMEVFSVTGFVDAHRFRG